MKASIRTIVVLVAVMATVALGSINAMSPQADRPIPRAHGDFGKDSFVLDIPPRYMWGWGPGLHGYCGETSFQMHGIYHGNWISSEEVRYASGGTELLVAVNAEKTAIDLSYQYSRWLWDEHNPPQNQEFVGDFIRSNINNGNVVVFGVYEELPKGDKDYDHIVPCIGYKNSTEVDKHTGEHSVEGIYFLDLYLNTTRFLSLDKDAKLRKDCKVKDVPSQPYNYCIPFQYDYGIALKGNVDTENVLVRFQLIMPTWTEPDWGKEDDLHQKPVPFTISAKAYGVVKGATYTVFKYDNKAEVPAADFAASSYVDKFTFTASDMTHTLAQFDTIMSDGTFFYRCIRTA